MSPRYDRSSLAPKQAVQQAVLALCCALSMGAADIRAEPSSTPNLPVEVTQAQQALGDWLTGLSDQSSATIVSKLGNPSERTTWKFEGKKELLLQYEMSEPKSTLALYFYRDRLIKASFQVLSD